MRSHTGWVAQVQKLIDALWHVVDVFWPCEQPLSRPEAQAGKDREAKEVDDCHRRSGSIPDREEILKEYLAECSKLVEEERSRRQSVEARLTTIIGLSSIAGTIAFGGLVAGAIASLRPQGLFLRCLVASGALYLILQLSCGILAAIRGLSRQSYLSQDVNDLLPKQSETRSVYLRRQINWSLKSLADHRAKNNAKVTQMAIAHRAMKNFVFGLIVFSLLWVPLAVTRKSANDLTEALRRNQELNELPRGPQGPQGPIGPKGEPCSGQPLSGRPSGTKP
jgi:hypothetical protein